MKTASKLFYFSIILWFFLCECQKKQNGETTLSGLRHEDFLTVIGSDSVRLITLNNGKGIELCLSNYGARIVSLMVPDAEGKGRNVVLGFKNIESYFPGEPLPKMGGTIGRYTNRIGGARFVLDGDTIKVTKNNLGHSLHGGAEDGDLGWQYKVFEVVEKNDSSVLMSYNSPDGENGFPGNVIASVRYTLATNNSLKIEYSAFTDRPTVVGMSNQSYFNLSGNPDNSISDQRLYINASFYLPVDSTRLVTGEIAEVENTPMDFREMKLIGRDIDNAWHEQIKHGKGYDHAFILDTKGDINKLAVSLHSKKSGITMEIYTTEPSVQFYTGNFLFGSLSRKNKENYSMRHGLSLEPEHFPDSPNHPEWPSVILRPGEKYSSTTIYRFKNK